VLWVLVDISLITVAIKHYYFSIGNYQCIIVDLPAKIFFRNRFILICYLEIRQLISS